MAFSFSAVDYFPVNIANFPSSSVGTIDNDPDEYDCESGIKLTASLRISELSRPGKQRQQVMLLMVAEIKWFKSPTYNLILISEYIY
ncbi:hypothetical protein LguiA_030263 [Lonicera macranthoides]